ncbi:MAG: response regulator transcription factor [Lachnospiraceae bacterium]|nr:response regulator transcription factor [Lachnospiraceae bacterium]
MNLNIAICDDEKIICNTIKQLLSTIRPDFTIHTFLSGKKLLESDQNYDIIFLDIEMPELDGIATAESLRQRQNPAFIIFLTSYAEYMLMAFKVRAFRFLTKPIDSCKLQEVIKEAEEEMLSNQKISIHSHGTIHLVNIADIICFEAYGDGTYIHTTSNEVLDSPYTLKYWLQAMDARQFSQTHKSYVVSFRHIKHIAGNNLQMNYMKQTIPISRRLNGKFKEKLNIYIRENSKHI